MIIDYMLTIIIMFNLIIILLGTEATPYEPYVDTSEELAKKLSDINEFLRVNL